MKNITIDDVSRSTVSELIINDRTLSVECVVNTMNSIIDNSILSGENYKKSFSLEDDAQKWLVAIDPKTAEGDERPNVAYFVVPAEKLTECGIVELTFYCGQSIWHTEPIQIVLWDYDNSGVMNNNTVKYIGFSDTTIVQEQLTRKVVQFTNNPTGCPLKVGHSLIVQAVPEDVIPDESWLWLEKCELYSLFDLAVCHDSSSGSIVVSIARAISDNTESHVYAEDNIPVPETNLSPILGVLAFVKCGTSVSSQGIDTTSVSETNIEAVDSAYKINGTGIGSIIADNAVGKSAHIYVKDPADETLSSGGDVNELSVIKVPKSEFDEYIAQGVKFPSPILWVVSSDVIDAYNEPVLNVNMESYPDHVSEATNKEYVDDMLSTKASINIDNEAIDLYGIQLHDVNDPEKIYKLYIQDGIIKLDKNF